MHKRISNSANANSNEIWQTHIQENSRFLMSNDKTKTERGRWMTHHLPNIGVEKCNFFPIKLKFLNIQHSISFRCCHSELWVQTQYFFGKENLLLWVSRTILPPILTLFKAISELETKTDEYCNSLQLLCGEMIEFFLYRGFLRPIGWGNPRWNKMFQFPEKVVVLQSIVFWINK